MGKADARTKDDFASVNLDENIGIEKIEKIIEKGVELGNLTSEKAIQNELTSYDLLRNDEYARLFNYEKILNLN